MSILSPEAVTLLLLRHDHITPELRSDLYRLSGRKRITTDEFCEIWEQYLSSYTWRGWHPAYNRWRRKVEQRMLDRVFFPKVDKVIAELEAERVAQIQQSQN